MTGSREGSPFRVEGLFGTPCPKPPFFQAEAKLLNDIAQGWVRVANQIDRYRELVRRSGANLANSLKVGQANFIRPAVGGTRQRRGERRISGLAGGEGFEPPVDLRLRQFSRLLQ